MVKRNNKQGGKTIKKKYYVITYIIVILLAFIFAYPFWHTAVLSFSDKAYANTVGFKFWPEDISLDAYKQAIASGSILTGYYNTIWRAVAGTLITLVITFAASFSMIHKDIPGWKFINFMIIFTMYFGGGVVPTYLNLKSLGLLNTRWVLVLPTAAGAWNFMVMRTFIKGIGMEMEEAARIDGAGVLQTAVRIYLPLSKPTIAVIGLWSFVNHWNAWFDSLTYANKSELMVLQTVVRRLIDQGNEYSQSGGSASMADMTPQTIRAATVIICTVPILLGYPFIQKYLVKGTMVGAVKG